MYEIEFYENGGWHAVDAYEGDLLMTVDEAEEYLRNDLVVNGPGFVEHARDITNYRIVSTEGQVVRTFTGQAWMDGRS
jgi:hypothetical protein